MLKLEHLRATLAHATEMIRAAHKSAEYVRDDPSESEKMEHFCTIAHDSTLIVADGLGLQNVVTDLRATMAKCKLSSLHSIGYFDGEPYSEAASTLSTISDSLSSLFGKRAHGIERNDLKEIITEANYYINDKDIFEASPKDERQVHNRTEGVLRCYYKNLQREAVLSKPIRSFRIDTGLPGLETIIEYKYLKTKQDAGKFVEQMLTDSVGYKDPKWKNILFVVYEVQRFYSDAKWKEVLQAHDLDEKADILVLQGESVTTRIKKIVKKSMKKIAKKPGTKLN